MLFIAHRINTIVELEQVPKSFGVEVDARSERGAVTLGHDPGMNGVMLEDFLKHYEHSFIIINIKTEKIEKTILEILQSFNIQNFFFLDSSMSTIVQMSDMASRKFCGRVSEFESTETITLSKYLVDWVWIDCFNKFCLTNEIYFKLKETLNKKICLTSPDLLGRDRDIPSHAEIIKNQGTYPDAICCKLSNIRVWEEELFGVF
jgi:hypothetical protein